MHDVERWRERVAHADDRISPGHSGVLARVSHPEGPVHLASPQVGHHLGNPSACFFEVVLGDLGADHRVDEVPDGVGERGVDRAATRDLRFGDVLQDEVHKATDQSVVAWVTKCGDAK